MWWCAGRCPRRFAAASSCGSGASPSALEECEYRAKLAKAGFEEIDVEPTRIYTAESASDYLARVGLGVEAIASIDGKFISVFVRARKPVL